MDQAPLTVRRWKRAEYERLVDLGVFEGEPLELIGGHLIVAEPKGTPHATAVGMADDALRAALPPGWIVRVQDPLPDASAPYGWRYGSLAALRPPAVITPLALPSARLAVAALLP